MILTANMLAIVVLFFRNNLHRPILYSQFTVLCLLIKNHK